MNKDAFEKIYAKPAACKGVKCMQGGCMNEADYKISTDNIYDPETETQKYKSVQREHPFTTYLCNRHWEMTFKREEFYGDLKLYAKRENMLIWRRDFIMGFIMMFLCTLLAGNLAIFPNQPFWQQPKFVGGVLSLLLAGLAYISHLLSKRLTNQLIASNKKHV